jgi:hypothetical protein
MLFVIEVKMCCCSGVDRNSLNQNSLSWQKFVQNENYV